MPCKELCRGGGESGGGPIDLILKHICKARMCPGNRAEEGKSKDAYCDLNSRLIVAKITSFQAVTTTG